MQVSEGNTLAEKTPKRKMFLKRRAPTNTSTVLWMRMTPTGTYTSILGLKLVELFGKD